MKHKFIISCLFLWALFPAFSAGQQDASNSASEDSAVIVFNAASTTDLMNDIGSLFEEKTGIIVKTNPASSGTLAHQIDEGAEADIYISASKKWMDYIVDLELQEQSDQFLKNHLVLIAPEDSALEEFTLSQETDFLNLFSGRISIGDPAHVPAGKYAEEALGYYGWYELLSDRIQPATDVRAALLVVEMGEAELGIVYETDAKKSDKVKIVSVFPDESHPPIIYFSALLKGNNPAGKEFYDFLFADEEVQELYFRYGFAMAENGEI